ncbi:MAG: TolC family protein [Alistipes shahii]|uniref:TolC family protein n=1 Tax=Alistipes shahii TaxID=328814 RepID=UPI00399C9E4C
MQVEKSDVDLSTAKYSRPPDLNASVGADASFGRVLSSDNTYQTKNQTSGSLNVSASMPLFQGMRINHRIKAGKLDLAAAVQDMERAREDVAINVMTLYLEVLYNKEMVGVAERQLTLSEQQAERSRTLAAAGKQPESAVYEKRRPRGRRACMTLTQARNDLQLASPT